MIAVPGDWSGHSNSATNACTASQRRRSQGELGMLPAKTKAIPFVRPFSAIGARVRSVIAQIIRQGGVTETVNRS